MHAITGIFPDQQYSNICSVWFRVVCLLAVTTATELYPYGAPLDTALMSGDDVSTSAISLPTPFVYYGEERTQLFISINGPISFEAPFLDFTEETNPVSSSYLTAFWDDVNINNGGVIYYRVSSEQGLLKRAADDVRNAGDVIDPNLVIVITWENVAQFNHTLTERNTFQVVLITDGQQSHAMFNYKSIEWAHSGVAAFNKGGVSKTIVNLPGSGDPIKMKQLSSYTNVCDPGRVVVRTHTDPVDVLRCCSMTSSGDLTKFDGSLLTITTKGRHLLSHDRRYPFDPCFFKVNAYMTAANPGAELNFPKTSIGTDPSNAKAPLKNILFDFKAPGRVIETNTENSTVLSLPHGYLIEGAEITVTGNRSRYEVISPSCPYYFYYGPKSPEPVIKIIFGVDFTGPNLGLCE